MKCKSAKCEADALYEVFWPGQTTVMCDPHAAQAMTIAQAMGFELAVRPLPLPFPEPAAGEETP